MTDTNAAQKAADERALRAAWLLSMDPEIAAVVTGKTTMGVSNAYRAFAAEARRQREVEAGFKPGAAA